MEAVVSVIIPCYRQAYFLPEAIERVLAQTHRAQVFWRLPDESQYTVPHRYVFAWHGRNEEQIVWIFQVIDQIAFHMGNRDVQRRVGMGDLPVTLLLLTKYYETRSRSARHRREIAPRIAAEVAPKETRTVVFAATKVFVCFK